VKNSFFLVIPAQETKPERLKEFEPKALEQWLFELPTANPGLATRLIQDFISDFNTLKMPYQLRLDVLEQIRPKVLIIEDYLRSRLIRTAFPKEENDLKILQVLAVIEREFTIGYWIVLKELSHRQVSWFQGKNLALSLQRCIKGLSSVVISHFIMGLPIPDWVWIDLHSLYKLSVKLKKDTVKVPDTTNHINKASSPEECYRQILLFCLSRPTGLMQKEILQVYGFIETLFPLFNLSTEAIEGQRFQFVVLTDEDSPPFAQVEMDTANDSATLYIDLTRLYKALEKKDKFISLTLSRFSSIHILKNHEEKPTAELLDYLEQRWLGLELQKAAIFSDRLDRYMAIGIAPSHSLQSWDSIQRRNMGDNENDQEILVHSESDRLLFCVFNKVGILSVGNLISFRRIDQPGSKRSLAVVNELIVAKQNGKISFGVNLIVNHYHAVYYGMANATDKDAPLKGIFYNTDEQLGDASFLVVDNFLLKEGDLIKMQMDQENTFLILRDKKNVGLGYWQFECQRVAAVEDKPQLPKKGYDFI
jgi:cyclic-di-GMP-binding protein